MSTVGEYVPDSVVRAILRQSHGRETNLGGDAEEAEFGFEEIGYHRLYETMVFRARPSTHECCPFERADGTELDFEGYNTAGEAYRGHLALIAKYSERLRERAGVASV